MRRRTPREIAYGKGFRAGRKGKVHPTDNPYLDPKQPGNYSEAATFWLLGHDAGTNDRKLRGLREAMDAVLRTREYFKP